jgi:hypothetical protein
MIWVTKFIEKHLKEKEERKIAWQKKVAEAEAEKERCEKEYREKYLDKGETPYRGTQIGFSGVGGPMGFGPIAGYKRNPSFMEIQTQIDEEYKDGEEMMEKIKSNKSKRRRTVNIPTDMDEWVKQARIKE